MNNISVHMRICAVSVSDSEVESRQAAAKSIATNWNKDTNPISINSTVADIALALNGDGIPSNELGNKIQIAIQKKSPSFLYEERPLDVGVCAGMALVSMLGGSHSVSGWSILDVYATALWSALSYQPVLEDVRRENLRREVLAAADSWYVTSAKKARERIDVPEPSVLKIEIDEDNAATSNFESVMAKTIDALSRNAALDREELDFLWWAQLGRSRILKKQIADIAEPTRIIAAGIEGAKLLRRLPCDVHNEIILRSLEENQELNLAELLEEIGDDRALLNSEFINDNVLTQPTIFPLLHALSTGETNQIGSSLKRPISEWGERALLEATFAQLISQGAGKL